MSKIIVIGGGLAGLSGAYHLQEFEPLVFEREDRVGGLCRSFTQDGFTFDVTGHLVHLKQPYTQELIDQILPGAFTKYERQAAIYSKSVTTPYPFQANTHGLPLDVVQECVVGFVESLGANHTESKNFHEWVLKTFGSGIAKHFMLPYNEKFWKRDLRTITADWVSWSIPKPTLEEVVNGALGMTNTGMGYNPRFSYPKQGGIQCLPEALAKPLGHIYTDHTVVRIDADKKVIRFAEGREETYDALLTTIPLPVVYELLNDAPDALVASARRLRALSVLNINVGVGRSKISDKHWIYFPEDQFVFSRVGFPMNFSENAAPEGTSSMYIEITHDSADTPDVEALYERSLRDLETCGILRREDTIRTRHVIQIPHAYVVFDRHRQACLEDLIDFLSTRNIFTAGRYGRWDYYSMEDSILSGKAAAEAIRTATESRLAR